jgi:phosphoesterase RecJ-like protein
MTNLSRSEAARWLGERDDFLILTHRRPDGDTLGSAAVLCRGLRQLGKRAHILENPEVTEKYLHLHRGLTQETAEGNQTLVCVDTAAPSMLPENAQPLLQNIALRIDHHGSATSFTPLELVDATAGATGDIIYDILVEMGVALDKPMAEALYTAVSTDTGCFRYANTNAHSYTVASACAQAGGDLHTINQEIFDTNSLARLRLQGWIVENIRFFRGGKLAACALPKAVEQQLGLTEDDMENISGFPRSIQGVKMAATLRECDEGTVKVSVRALPGYDAAAVCQAFGGGGHKGAAGATLKMTLEQAAEAVAAEMIRIDNGQWTMDN